MSSPHLSLREQREISKKIGELVEARRRLGLKENEEKKESAKVMANKTRRKQTKKESRGRMPGLNIPVTVNVTTLSHWTAAINQNGITKLTDAELCVLLGSELVPGPDGFAEGIYF